MNLTKNIIIFFFFIFFSSQAISENNIYYIDVDFIVKNSEKGKKIIKNLETINKKNSDLLNEEKLNLLSIEKNIKQKKNILSEEELNSKITDLNSKVNEFNLKKKKINKEFQKMKKKELNEFFIKVEKLIASYVKEKSIDLLIDKKTVFVGVSSLDVTKDVLNLVNKNIK